MGRTYVFYNPLSGDGRVLEDLDALEFVLEEACVFCDMTKPETYGESLFAMEAEDTLLLCGGDGTLHRFVNLTQELDLPNPVDYYPAGDHNDFARDFGRCYGCNPFSVTKALRRLPFVQVGNRTGRFLTGILFQTDSGIRRTSRRGNDYNEQNSPQALRVQVDGEDHAYDKVRFAAILTGRHCDGGMVPDPSRSRRDSDLSCVLIHGCGKWRARYLLAGMRQGRKVTSRYLTILRGEHLCVAFEKPVCLCTDGETQAGIQEVTAWKSRAGEEIQ